MKLSSSFTRDVVCVAYRLHTPDTMSCASALERAAGVEGAAAVVAAGAGVRCFGAISVSGEEEEVVVGRSSKAIGARVVCVWRACGVESYAGAWGGLALRPRMRTGLLGWLGRPRPPQPFT
jgi:hypothetical protein